MNFQGMSIQTQTFVVGYHLIAKTLSMKMHILSSFLQSNLVHDTPYLHCTIHPVRHNCKQLYYASYHFVTKYEDAKEIERVLWKFPPTHPCIAMKKSLKGLASTKRKFKLWKKVSNASSLLWGLFMSL